jgi:hypothetical protein
MHSVVTEPGEPELVEHQAVVNARRAASLE